MIRGLYTSATGLDAGMRQMDVISSNLANASTPGFKREQILFQSLLDREIYRFSEQPPVFLGRLGTGVNFRQGRSDWSAGLPLLTNNPLDIALVDETGDSQEQLTFLAVESAQHGRAYTRNGQMKVDGQGYLRTQAGAYVLGQDPTGTTQRLRIDTPAELKIAPDGALTDAAGLSLGRLYLINPSANANMTRLGDSLWTIEGDVQVAVTPSVVQGHVEQANVQVVREMVNLITAMRNYETNTKLVQIQDETLSKAVNEVGRL